MSILKKQVKVRFAPSPTGFLHIGGLRTALYNYLFAKKNKGKFILRIEDTDRERLVKGGVENIKKTLNDAGLDYDEGPDKDGGNGPYIQSERLPIYKKYIGDLLESDKAYYCFCTPKELEAEREKQRQAKLPTKYNKKCAVLTREDAEVRIKSGEAHVVRMRVPEEGSTVVNDLVYGDVEVLNKNIDDQVLIKSDGFPTYHFANVVDDHLMGITHVIRGEEWMPSTPKHVLLYNAFGWPLPNFAHLPLLLNEDKSKLSKRQGDVAVEDYLKKGYLPEALINFVALLGWNPKGDQEIYELDELIRYFDLKSVNKGGAVFNTQKLYWMNGDYIRRLNIDDLVDLCIPQLVDTGLMVVQEKDFMIKDTGEVVDRKWLTRVIELEHDRLKRIDEVPGLTELFFVETLDYEGDTLVWKKSDKASTKKNLEALSELLHEVSEKDFDDLEKIVRGFIEEKELGNGDVLWPMRVALSGLLSSPSPFELARVLGKEKVLKRLKDAVNKL